jgi:hypothetical protein
MAERLREERPSLDGLALDRAKTRAQARATAAQRGAGIHSKGAFLKSRLAITMILALGALMSLGGVGLAVNGLSDSGDGAEVQYLTDESSDESLGGDSGTGSDSVGASDVDPAGQESTGGGGGGDELAFTGFLAIPVLIGGLALLGSGFVLRRRTDRDDR